MKGKYRFSFLHFSLLAGALILQNQWIFFGFAVGAFFMGAMIWLGVGAGLSLAWSLVIFAVLSLIAYILLRQSLCDIRH